MRLSWRELRGGLLGFRLFVACLALGVATIAGIGSLSSAIVAGLERDGRLLLGGDIEFRLIHRPAEPRERAFLDSQGQVSETVQMRAMAHAPASDQSTLVELKAVDAAYPLLGTMALQPAQPLADALARQGDTRNVTWGAVVDEQALIRLDAKIGDELRIGEGRFRIHATIAREPDRATEGLTLGPRVMLARAALDATGLVQPGSLSFFHYRVALAPGITSESVTEGAKRDFAESGWRIRDWRGGNPGLRRFLDRAGLFLVLVGLTALLIGGVGVANAVHAHMQAKTSTIATLKSLGATTALIFRVYLWQTFLLAGIGIAIGLGLGALLPMLATQALSAALPVPLAIGIYWEPLLVAALYGFLVALAFALWPLARAADIRPAALYRDLVTPGLNWPRWPYLVATVLLFGALASLAIFSAEVPRFAAYFVLGATISFGFFRLLAWGLGKVAGKIEPPRGSGRWGARLRLAFAALHRPGSATASLMLSLGVALTLLVTMAQVEGNLHAQVEERLPDEAPAFFFVDIQPDQLEAFRALVAATPGSGAVQTVPNLRGRVVKVGDVPAEQVQVNPEQRWVLQGDRGLTYSRTLPEGSSLVEGQWWAADYDGPPLISLEEAAAKGLGVKIGDSLTVNILGRDIEARIANIRRLDWSSLGINFVIVFSPGLLERAPHTHLATVKATPDGETALFKAVTRQIPGISVIRMKDVLTEINNLVTKLGSAVRGAAVVTLVAGLLVLAGALAAEHRRRLREGAILKALGATRSDILAANLLEYAAIGLVGATLAYGLGLAAAWGIVAKVMNAGFVPLAGTALLTAVGGLGVALLLGLGGAWATLNAKPAPLLRQS
ncbi:MAG: FtsX-like permease family protein [Ferrovibrio sp.]|nr:FtsX-like permease family protein [Ferrovibrio sp.]